MLKFHAKPGLSTPWPNSHVGGQARRLVGRTFVAPKDGVPASYPASNEPDQLNDDDEDARHLVRKCSRGELWPADKYTADVCGVAFVELAKGADGEWFPKPSKPASASASKE